MPIGCDSSPLGSKILFSFRSRSFTRIHSSRPRFSIRSRIRFRTLSLSLSRTGFLRLLDTHSRKFFPSNFLLDTRTVQHSHKNFSDNNRRLAIHISLFSPSVSKRLEIFGRSIACFQNRRASSNGAREPEIVTPPWKYTQLYSTLRLAR